MATTPCDNVVKPKDLDLVVCTSDVTCYDGPAASCLNYGASPTLNTIIQTLEAAICANQSHTHATSAVTSYDGTPSFACFSVSGTLNNVINQIGDQICINTAAIAALDCSDIEVTSQYTAVNYTPTSSNLCGHIEGIDDALASLTSSVPTCLGTILFTDGDNGTMEANITGMTSGQFTLTQSSTQKFLGSNSLSAVRFSGSGAQEVTHSTAISMLSTNRYTATVYIFIDSGTAGTTASSPITLTNTGTGLATSFSSVQNDDTSQYDKWLKFEHSFTPKTNQNVTYKINLPDFSNGSTIYIDHFSIVCAPADPIAPGGGGGGVLITGSVLAGQLSNLTNNATIEAGSVTSSPSSLNVDLDDSKYIIDGAEILAPDTSTTTSLTMATTSDNYVFATANGDGVDAETPYKVKSVALAAPQPTTNAGEMILYKFVTDGVGVTATTDLQNLYVFDGSMLADNSIITRHITDLNVTGAKMEDVVSGATVQAANVTFDDKGRITAATTEFTITTPALDEILIHNGSKFVNVPIVGNILPTGTDDDTMRYDSGSGEWLASSLLKNTGTAIGITTTTPQATFAMAKLLSFGIEMEEPQNPSATAVAGGSLADDTYYYAVTALDDNGETIAATEVNATTSGANNTVDVTWDHTTGAQSYKIYKGTATGTYTEEFTETVPSGGWSATHTFSDDGTAGGATSGPPTTTDSFNTYLNTTLTEIFADVIVSDHLTSTTFRANGEDKLMINASGQVLINGATALTGSVQFQVDGGAGGTILNRVSSDVSTTRQPLSVVHQTSAAASDGFGTELGLYMYDSSASLTEQAQLVTQRDGADNQAILSIGIADSGAPNANLKFDFQKKGILGIGAIGRTALGNVAGSNAIAIKNGTATSVEADLFSIYSQDIVAGNAAPHILTENGDIVKIYSIGGWGSPTGTATRTTFDTSTVTLSQLAERVKAMIDNLRDGHQLFKA